VQSVGDGVFAAVDEVEESADFGEGEVDETPVNAGCGFRFGRLVGRVGV
jgi:hypothetical protein